MTLIKLGEDLELDPRAYELRRAGRAVRLERIPMEILLFLLERRTELVTREEIVERIWGKGVFLDTDNSINGAIRKIRQALRDDPEEPRFIRTITGKGYRFIAPPIEETAEIPAEESAGPAIEGPAGSAAAGPPSSAAAGARLGRVGWLLLAALVVVAVGVGAYVRRSSASLAPASAGRQMLAVLPFDNLTGDAGQDFFCDGFTEEMITRLGSLEPRRLGVIARTSAMSYKNTRAPLERLGQELGVQYVLEGSIRRDSRDPRRVRITAQLIELKGQTHLWARQFDREDTDVLRIQEEIARSITDQIGPFLGEPRRKIERAPAFSNREYEAYEHYLRGRYFWSQRNSADFQRAVESFQRAIATNPDDARFHAALADTYTLMGTYGYVPERDIFPKARAAALKALEIDDDLAAAHTSLALINEMFDMDYPTAEGRFKRAIELEPNYATAHHWYAEFLGYQGRSDEALAEIAVARRLDPRSLIMAVDHGYILTWARQYDRAIEEFQAALAMKPRFPRAMGGLIGAYVNQGRLAEALEEARRWRRFDASMWPWLAEVYVLGRLGEMEQAEEALRHMEEAARRQNQDLSGPRSFAYLGMHRREEVLDMMQESCEKYPWRLIGIRVEPGLDWLRDDPRFQELVRCARMAP